MRIKKLMGFEIEFCFAIIYLENVPVEMNTKAKHLFKIFLAASKKAITKRWLDKDPPMAGEWSAIVKDVCDMEKMTFSLRLCKDKFQRYWSKWFSSLLKDCEKCGEWIFFIPFPFSFHLT